MHYIVEALLGLSGRHCCLPIALLWLILYTSSTKKDKRGKWHFPPRILDADRNRDPFGPDPCKG